MFSLLIVYLIIQCVCLRSSVSAHNNTDKKNNQSGECTSLAPISRKAFQGSEAGWILFSFIIILLVGCKIYHKGINKKWILQIKRDVSLGNIPKMHIFVYPPLIYHDKMIENYAFLLHFAFWFIPSSTVLFDDKKRFFTQKSLLCLWN